MFKFFKKKEEAEEGKKAGFVKGLVIGIICAAIIVLIAIGIVFGGAIKDRLFGAKDDGPADGAKLRITIITKKDCTGCWDVNLLLDALKQQSVKEIGRETIYFDSRKGKKLVEQYKITKVPTVLIAGELDKDEKLKAAWPTLGEIIDGVFVFRQVIPPYIEVATGNLRGTFSVVYLTDQSCAKCYDVKLHENALKSLGMTTKESRTVDVTSDEGKELVKKYGIKLVPTIILSGDLADYQGLQQIWSSYGTVDKDGTYVFTGVAEMGTYKDLSKNQVVEVKLTQPTNQ